MPPTAYAGQILEIDLTSGGHSTRELTQDLADRNVLTDLLRRRVDLGLLVGRPNQHHPAIGTRNGPLDEDDVVGEPAVAELAVLAERPHPRAGPPGELAQVAEVHLAAGVRQGRLGI